MKPNVKFSYRRLNSKKASHTEKPHVISHVKSSVELEHVTYRISDLFVKVNFTCEIIISCVELEHFAGGVNVKFSLGPEL